MQKKRSLEYWLQTIGFFIFAIGIICWLIWTIYVAFYIPDKPKEAIRFEVTGVVNGTEADTVVQVHFECIKYCSSHVSDGYMKDCWAECAKLGKEVCGR